MATPCLSKRKQFIFHSELVDVIALGIVDLSVMRVMFLAGKQVHTCTIAAVALAASKIVGSRHGKKCFCQGKLLTCSHDFTRFHMSHVTYVSHITSKVPHWSRRFRHIFRKAGSNGSKGSKGAKGAGGSVSASCEPKGSRNKNPSVSIGFFSVFPCFFAVPMVL